MRKLKKAVEICAALLSAVLIFSGCGAEENNSSASSAYASGGHRATRTEYLLPEASGTAVSRGESYVVDYSNTSDGYIMVSYSGGAEKTKAQITQPDGVTYTYTVYPSSEYVTLPLTGGSGKYGVALLEHAFDDNYGFLANLTISADAVDEFLPFLYPNQYVWYEQGYETVAFAAGLSDESEDDLAFVTEVYRYIIENITYDKEAAENVSAGYVPNVEATLATGKGICFDYASLMAAMLRSQGVPTRLQVGYSGSAYHAWISVYLEETGWVDNVIEFDGESWSLMDPTLAAGNNAKSVKNYVGDGSNYIVKYSY